MAKNTNKTEETEQTNPNVPALTGNPDGTKTYALGMFTGALPDGFASIFKRAGLPTFIKPGQMLPGQMVCGKVLKIDDSPKAEFKNSKVVNLLAYDVNTMKPLEDAKGGGEYTFPLTGYVKNAFGKDDKETESRVGQIVLIKYDGSKDSSKYFEGQGKKKKAKKMHVFEVFFAPDPEAAKSTGKNK